MICLSFDIEEFDLPLEHGYNMPLERQMEISRAGTNRILDILKRHGVKATFFITVNFARHAPKELTRIVNEGHEVGSHGMNHSAFKPEDLLASRLQLEELTSRPVHGYRMARMMNVPEHEIAAAGYLYESSLNPTFIPGRYMNLNKPRRPYMVDGAFMQLPASVTPMVRFPMFWLSAHLLPAGVYHRMVKSIIKTDGHFLTYFHPWEFYDLNSITDEVKLPAIIRRHSGDGMAERLDGLIDRFKARGEEFITLFDLYQREIKRLSK